MGTSVVIPWRHGCEWREPALAWVRAQLERDHPDWPVILGESSPGPFSRTQAILDGLAQTTSSIVIVMDGDVYCDPAAAVDQVHEHGWAIPHLMLHRLSPESTQQVLAGADWHGLPLSDDNRQDAKPYRGHETDTLCVFRADVLAAVPPDRRFVGWGQEGDAWSLALHTIIGPPWRGDADLPHLWHPPQPRLSRSVGNEANLALYRRYRVARRRPALMATLLEEARA